MTLQASPPGKTVVHWAVWLRYGTQWSLQILRAAEFTVLAQRDGLKEPNATLSTIVVSAINRVGNESPKTRLDLSQIGLGSRG